MNVRVFKNLCPHAICTLRLKALPGGQRRRNFSSESGSSDMPVNLQSRLRKPARQKKLNWTEVSPVTTLIPTALMMMMMMWTEVKFRGGWRPKGVSWSSCPGCNPELVGEEGEALPAAWQNQSPSPSCSVPQRMKELSPAGWHQLQVTTATWPAHWAAP